MQWPGSNQSGEHLRLSNITKLLVMSEARVEGKLKSNPYVVSSPLNATERPYAVSRPQGIKVLI